MQHVVGKRIRGPVNRRLGLPDGNNLLPDFDFSHPNTYAYEALSILLLGRAAALFAGVQHFSVHGLEVRH